MDTPKTSNALIKYWVAIFAIVACIGTGVGRLGQSKLEHTPSLLVMDHATQTQIFNRLDKNDIRIDSLDTRVTTLETNGQQVPAKHKQ